MSHTRLCPCHKLAKSRNAHMRDGSKADDRLIRSGISTDSLAIISIWSPVRSCTKEQGGVSLHTRLQESVGLKPQSGEMFIANGDTQSPIARLEGNAQHFAQVGRAEMKRGLLSINISCLTALFPTDS